MKLFFAGEDVSAISSAAERENVRVFKKEELLRRLARAQALDGLLLHRQPVWIANLPQPPRFANPNGMSYLHDHEQFAALYGRPSVAAPR